MTVKKLRLTPLAIAVTISILSMPFACMKIYPGAHQLAIDITAELKTHLCQKPFRPGDPCGDRDARFDADLGNAIYLYIFGVSDSGEIQGLVRMATELRDNRDKRIPVHITFYSDLTKSNEIQTIKIAGN